MSDAMTLQGRVPVAELQADARARFISRTYLHLLFAIIGFAAIEIVLFQTGLAVKIAEAMMSVSWLLVLGGFIVVGWLASRTAHRARSIATQYTALAAFVAAEAIIFVPLLYVAEYHASGVIESAALVTAVGFLGLTIIAWMTGKDFTFLGGILRWGFVVALALIVAGVVFGFQLGTFFSVGMIALAGGAILYDTSNILRHYPEDRYVGAALELFASVALLFWYVISFFLSRE